MKRVSDICRFWRSWQCASQVSVYRVSTGGNLQAVERSWFQRSKRAAHQALWQRPFRVKTIAGTPLGRSQMCAHRQSLPAVCLREVTSFYRMRSRGFSPKLETPFHTVGCGFRRVFTGRAEHRSHHEKKVCKTIHWGAHKTHTLSGLSLLLPTRSTLTWTSLLTPTWLEKKGPTQWARSACWQHHELQRKQNVKSMMCLTCYIALGVDSVTWEKDWRDDFGSSHFVSSFFDFCNFFQLSRSHAWREWEHGVKTTSCSMRRGFVRCKVADHHQSSGLGQTTSSVSVSLGMFNAARKHRFRMCMQRPRRTPEETEAMAATKVRRTEVVIAALGDDDGEELATLQSCVRCARFQTQVPPVEKRIADCPQFIERVKKRTEAARDASRFCNGKWQCRMLVHQRRVDHLIKICTDAGFLKTVEVGQYCMTKHTDELLQFAKSVTCRGYTLPRDEKSTDWKGWIRGNTKIGPVLEVTNSYLQGKHGVGIRIESVNKDNSHSWVRISHDVNKLVTDSIDKEYDDEQEISTTRTKVFAFASRSKTKAKPRRHSIACSSSRTVPILERIWIYIEPGAQFDQAYSVAKRINTLLRHGELLRKDDGAIEFWRLKDDLRNKFSTLNIGLMMYGKARGNKKKISILYWSLRRRNSPSPSSSRSVRTQSHWPFNSGQFLRVHLSYWIRNQFTLITSSGLISGGQNSSKGQTDDIFTAVNPMYKNHQDRIELDLTKRRLTSYKQKWKMHHDTVYGVDIQLTQRKGLKFYQTKSNAIILNDTLAAYFYAESNCDEIWKS